MRLNSNNLPLSGKQVDDFRLALREAFSERASFDDFLFIQFNQHIGDLSPECPFPQQLLHIIKNVDEDGWSAELLQAACLWRPLDIALATFAQQFGLMPTSSVQEVFESKVRPLDPDLDVGPWCARLAELVPKICRIDFPSGISSKLGTGFLVGINTVMTCFHVMRDVLQNRVDPTKVSLLFDYKVLEDGRTFSDGVVYHLSRENWWLDYSEFSPLDGKINSGKDSPDEDHLDYILLRVEGTPGLDPIGGGVNKKPQPEKRGWVELPSSPLEPVPSMGLFILHHPDGKRVKITLNTASVHSVNGNRTRILHQTNTANGTSGAPCFNYNWELVALHQTGDPATDKNHSAEVNQSIPFAAIRKRLESRDMLRYLGDGQQTNQASTSPPPAPPLPAEEQIPDLPSPAPDAPEDAQNSPCLPRTPSLPDNKPEAVDTENPSPPETQAELEMTESELSPLKQARTYIDKAQQNLDETRALFANSQTYILPKRFDEAICLLEDISKNINDLQTLLKRESSLLSIIKEHAGDVYHQINTTFAQIEQCLIPNFRQRTRGNFSQLQSALDRINRYFSMKG